MVDHKINIFLEIPLIINYYGILHSDFDLLEVLFINLSVELDLTFDCQ